MANLNKLYSQFNDKITLTSSKTDSLRTSRNALRTDIKNWFSNKSKLQPKFCWQGSFAMKTVINTIGDNEYDLDDGVYIQGYDDVELEDWPVASTVHKWVKDAVSERTKKDPADKKTCIRVTYADGYHIDLPMYIVKDDTAFLAHKTNGWIESDPKAFKEWFVSKVQDEQYGDQLRRLVKVLKAWKDYNEIDLKGVELTILATNAFASQEIQQKPAFYIRIYYSDSRLCGDTYHGICKALHAAELVHTLPAGYFDLSGLWYAQCYHDYISFRFC